jgi:hypothetical protein
LRAENAALKARMAELERRLEVGTRPADGACVRDPNRPCASAGSMLGAYSFPAKFNEGAIEGSGYAVYLGPKSPL